MQEIYIRFIPTNWVSIDLATSLLAKIRHCSDPRPIPVDISCDVFPLPISLHLFTRRKWLITFAQCLRRQNVPQKQFVVHANPLHLLLSDELMTQIQYLRQIIPHSSIFIVLFASKSIFNEILFILLLSNLPGTNGIFR